MEKKQKQKGPNQVYRNNKKKKRQTMEWEKILANDAMDKGFISKTYSFYISTTQEPTHSEEKAEDLNWHFSKEDI